MGKCLRIFTRSTTLPNAMDKRPPRTGNPILDNLLLATWASLAFVNNWVSVSAFADLMVGLGAAATLVLTCLRIYEHLMGETLTTTLTEKEGEVNA
jgi:hypothetical protein